MSARVIACICLASMIGFMTISQLLFKQAGLYVADQSVGLAGFVLNPWLWVSLLTSACGLVCWMIVLKEFRLATAYPWTGLIYAATPLLSIYFFNETLSDRFFFGMTLIVVGVFLTAGGTKSQ